MKLVELIISELSDFLGFTENSLVDKPAIEENFFYFREQEVDEFIVSKLIELEMDKYVKLVNKLPGETRDNYLQRCIPTLLDEGYPEDQAIAICYSEFVQMDKSEDVYELKIGDYQTRHYDMCPGASELYKKIESGEIETDMGLAIRAAKLQDVLFWLEKHTVKEMGKATFEDVVAAQNLAYEIMQLAEGMGLTQEHQYIYGHIQAIRDLSGDTSLDMDTTGLAPYNDQISGSIVTERFESYNDYPQAASDNACKVLRWIDEHGRDEVEGMTQVGLARANQLCNRENISEDTIARMSAFSRHRQNAEIADEYKGTPWKDKGYVAWLGWGGDEGVNWATRKLEQIRKEMSTQKFSFASEEERIVVGPMLIPNKRILRIDENGNPYHVFFSEDTVRAIAEKMMKDKLLDRLNAQHDPNQPIEGNMLETWIIEDPKRDKAAIYGFEHLPPGSWMGMYRIESEDAWKRVKSGELKGFSIEAFLAERVVSN